MDRQQLYCTVQSRSPDHCQTTTGKVQSSARDGTSSSDGAFLTDDDRLFHARAEATGKARSPSVERLVDGTTSMAELAERRRRRVSTSDVWCRLSARYSVGACVADTNARGQLMLILGTMHNFEEYAIVIQKNDGAIFLKSTLIQF